MFTITKELICALVSEKMKTKGTSDNKDERINLVASRGIDTMGVHYFPTHESIIKLIKSQDSFMEYTVSRGLIHSKDFNFSHFSSRVWGIDKDNNVLFQLRGFLKDHNAGLLDAPISGHLRIIAHAKEDTVREFEEETGLSYEKEDVKLWFISNKHEEYFDEHTQTIFSDKEFVFEHLWKIDDCKELLNNVHPLEGEGKKPFEEVAGFFYINMNDLELLFSGQIEKIENVKGITEHGKTIYRDVDIYSFARKSPYFYNQLFKSLKEQNQQ